MSEWKDLEIGNIPSDFFVNNRYETECYGHNGWSHCFSDFKNKIAMVELVHDRDGKYQYRLRPLENIKITKDMADYLICHRYRLDYCDGLVEQLAEDYGRKVEIID